MNENENEKKKNSWLPIVGGIALIIVLFIVVPEPVPGAARRRWPGGPGARVLPLLRGGDDRQLPVGAVLSILWRKGGAVT